jgi:hypothetical protein
LYESRFTVERRAQADDDIVSWTLSRPRPGVIAAPAVSIGLRQP